MLWIIYGSQNFVWYFDTRIFFATHILHFQVVCTLWRNAYERQRTQEQIPERPSAALIMGFYTYR